MDQPRRVALRIIGAAHTAQKSLTYKNKKWSSKKICSVRTGGTCRTLLKNVKWTKYNRTSLCRRRSRTKKARAHQRRPLKVSSIKTRQKMYRCSQRATLRSLSLRTVETLSSKTNRWTSRMRTLSTTPATTRIRPSELAQNTPDYILAKAPFHPLEVN